MRLTCAQIGIHFTSISATWGGRQARKTLPEPAPFTKAPRNPGHSRIILRMFAGAIDPASRTISMEQTMSRKSRGDGDSPRRPNTPPAENWTDPNSKTQLCLNCGIKPVGKACHEDLQRAECAFCSVRCCYEWAAKQLEEQGIAWCLDHHSWTLPDFRCIECEIANLDEDDAVSVPDAAQIVAKKGVDHV